MSICVWPGAAARRHPLCLAAGAMIMIIAVMMSAVVAGTHFGWFRSAAASQKKKPVVTPSVLLTLTRKGFYPAEISIPQDPFFLVFENRSGLDDLDLQFDRATGGRLKEVSIVKEEPEWIEFLNLNPGDYVISDGRHPELRFRLRVTPR